MFLIPFFSTILYILFVDLNKSSLKKSDVTRENIVPCELCFLWPNREGSSCSICLVLSILAYTLFQMFGGTIPTNKYKSSMSACEDLAHTGAVPLFL